MANLRDKTAIEREIIAGSLGALEELAAERAWAGYDPRDALRSPFLGWLPGDWLRLAATQLVCRLPFNPRPLLLYGPSPDSKGLSLFLRGLLRVAGLNALDGDRSAARVRLDRAGKVFALLRKEPSVRKHGPFGWGYPFPWQSRHLGWVGPWEPNAVCCAYVGEALLDLAGVAPSAGQPPLAMPPAEFLAGPLPRDTRAEARRMAWQNAVYLTRFHPRDESDEEVVFAYTPVDREKIHNASLLVAGYLGRFARAVATDAAFAKRAAEDLARATKAETPEERHRLAPDWRGGSLAAECWELAAKAAASAVNSQREDGGWAYGVGAKQQWTDSFHTGYNLLALKQLRGDLRGAQSLAANLDGWRDAKKRRALFASLDDCLKRGFADYRRKFLDDAPDGMVSYHEHGAGPLDTHAVAHAALCLGGFDHEEEGRERLTRLIAAMQDPMDGRFYYQRRQGGGVNKVEYLRWTQAWAYWSLAGSLSFAASNDPGEGGLAPEEKAEGEGAIPPPVHSAFTSPIPPESAATR